MKILCIFLFLLMVGFSQSLPQRENFKNSMTAAMLKDIQAAMDNGDFDPLYFLENVVPTCKALMYVNWNVTTKFLEESLEPMAPNENDRDDSFRRKKRRVSKSCPPGKWGEDCGNDCPCLNGAQCNPLTGECTCTPGWHGQQCNIKCPYRTYGQGCKERCNCQNGGNCDHISGACTCTPGWRGAL